MRHIYNTAFAIAVLLLTGCAGKPTLIDWPKSAVALNLTPAQQESLTPKALLLQDVAEDYEFDSEQLDADYQRYRNAQTLYPQSRYEGNIPNLDARQEREQLREKLGRFLRQRQAYAKEVAGLVDEIRADLTAEQQLVFDTLEPPKLELPKALKQLQRDQFMRIPGVHGARPDDF